MGNTYLSLFDLYQLRLPVELITLSGCSTGLNVVGAGDELIGLARGLLHAGAQSLVLSLWDVHDKSTAEFMVFFYSLLRQGQSKAAALRGAMLAMRSSFETKSSGFMLSTYSNFGPALHEGSSLCHF